ncbi:MAG: lipopolysaccharide transport system ATP-binding protein [Paraglaciecola sp.]|jgi:lipopolysaccharide transport system ATP-binding protein
MSEIAIKLENVSKYYKLYGASKDRLKEALHPLGRKYHKPFYALKGLSLEIKKGDVLGVVGRNGCGKSTLLKVITGVLQPSEGEVLVEGKVTALLELGAGFNPEFTGIQNIKFYGAILGLSKEEIESKLSEIIDFSELGEFINQPLKTYSSGMKSRLGFSVAVNVGADVLVLDEVLAVGDVFFRRKCFARMESLLKDGKTVIFVSHDAQSIVQLCNKAVFINDGKIESFGAPKEVIDAYNDFTIKANDYGGAHNLRVQEKGSGPIETGGAVVSSEVVISSCLMSHPEGGSGLSILKCGKEYAFSYVATTVEAQKKVRFAFIIKDVKGIALGGAMMMDKDIFRAGEAVVVKKNFYCNFKPGTYFVTVTVTSRESEQPKVLTKVVDAISFKIESWPEDGYWGLTYIADRRELK